LKHSESVKDRWHQRLEMPHTIRCGPDQENAERQRGETLLVLNAPIHRHQDIVFTPHALQKLAVLDTSPTATANGVYLVTVKSPGECSRQLLVKQNSHW
jgi:hypothetical protein